MTGRDDPLGRRALFGAPPPGTEMTAGDAPAAGRRALFSAAPAGFSAAPAGFSAAPAPSAQEEPENRGRRVAVECGSCRARTPLGLLSAVGHLIPSVWVPTRRLSRLMRCPSCGRLTWCRVDWWGLLRA